MAHKPANAKSSVDCHELMSDLEQKWTDKTSEKEIAKVLNETFAESDNPFKLVVSLLQNAQEEQTGKNITISFFILTVFDNWFNEHKQVIKTDKLLDTDIQLHMFEICTRHHAKIFETARRCFKLSSLNKDKCLPVICKLLQNHAFVEAARWTCKLGLQHHFSFTEIQLPLLVHNELYMLEQYLRGFPDLQGELVLYLDRLNNGKADLGEIKRQIPKSPGTKKDKFKKGFLQTLAVELLKLYEIPQEKCPHIRNIIDNMEIRQVVITRFVQKNIGDVLREQTARLAVGESTYRKRQFILHLAVNKMMDEAIKWANEFGLPKKKIPSMVRKARDEMISVEEKSPNQAESSSNSSNSGSGQDEEVSEKYHQLKLPSESIIVVDTLEKYADCMNYITRPGRIVGIDSEWKPSFSGPAERLALLQLAVRDRVFLLDLLALQNVFKDPVWQSFAESFFCSNDVLKIGYGLETDLKMLLKTFPCISTAMTRVKRVVDIESLAKKLVMKNKKKTPLKKTNMATGSPIVTELACASIKEEAIIVEQACASEDTGRVHATTDKEQIHTSTDKEQIHTSTDTEQIHTSTDMEQIQTTTDVDQIQTSTDVDQQHLSTNMEQIHLSTDMEQIHSSTDMGQIHSSTDMEQIHSSTDMEQIHSSTGMEQIHSSTEMEQMHTSTDVEQIYTSTDVDQIQTSTDVDQIQTSTDVDQIQTSTDVDQLHLSTDMEQNNLSTDMGQIHSSTDMDQIHSSTDKKQIHTSTDIEQRYTSTDMEQIHSSTDVNQIHSSTEMEQKHPSTDMEQSHTSTDMEQIVTTNDNDVGDENKLHATVKAKSKTSRKRKRPVRLTKTGTVPVKGFSKVVQECFGKPLNKMEQLSDWETRPLRDEQVKYAALDAFALLEVYDELLRLAKDQDSNIDVEPEIKNTWLKQSKSERRQARQKTKVCEEN